MDSVKAKTHAARLLNVGKSKIFIQQNSFEKIKAAITKDDVRALIKDGIISKKNVNEYSRGRARILHSKKAKGRKKGFGKRTGTKKARSNEHRVWISGIRAQRKKLRELRKKFPKTVKKIGYGKLYKKIKGGFFKGKKYIEALVKDASKSLK